MPFDRIMENRQIIISHPKDTVVKVYPTPAKHLKTSYVRSFQEELLTLAVDRDFNGTDLRILLAILSNLGYDNILNISQKDLGEKIGIKQTESAKSIKKLISKGYLQIVGKAGGRQNIYQFNPHVAFRSRARNYKELCRAWQQESIPNTEKLPVDIDSDLDIDLENKLDDKVLELSQQFNVPKSKVRQIILSLVDQTLDTETQESSEIPY